MSKKKSSSIHKLNPKGQQAGFRQQKKPTRIERLENAVKQLSSLPQFLLQRFQELVKVVEDVRFTYEVLGRLLQDKGLVSQEEITELGNKIVEERKKEREERKKKLEEEAKRKTEEDQKKIDEKKSDIDREKIEKDVIVGKIEGELTEEEVKQELSVPEVPNHPDAEVRGEVAKDLMSPREDLQEKQIQDNDISVKDVASEQQRK